MRILINAGHGGNDCGAVGKKGLKESFVNLNVAKLVKKYLNDKNISCVVFQQEKSLNEVINFCNTNKFDFGVSIHCNASIDRQANGIETLYYLTSKYGKKLADLIQQELVETTHLKDRGIKPRSDLGFLKRTNKVCVLVECAFISNEKEEELLKNNYSLFSQAITRGIVKFIENEDND